MNLKEIYETVKSGDIQKIIGLPESDVFDVKSGIYDISNHKGKFELAKDVCSFANAGGGIILIGFKTNQSETSMKEYVSEMHPIDRDSVNLDAYRKILADMVYPRIANFLEVDLRECDAESKKCIIYVLDFPALFTLSHKTSG